MDLERAQFLVLVTCTQPDCLCTRLSCDCPLFCFGAACLIYYGQTSAVTCSYARFALLICVVTSGCLLGNLVVHGQ